VKGTQVLWFDAVGRIPVRIGIPIELTAPMRPPASTFLLLSYIEGSRCLSRSTCHSILAPFSIAVGTVIADRPPHRPVRAELPHTVLTADVDTQTSRWDRGGGSSESVASVCRAWRTLPKSGGGLVDCVAGGYAAT